MFGIALGQLIGGLGADHWGPAGIRDPRRLVRGRCGAAVALRAGRDPATPERAPARPSARFMAVLRIPWARFLLGVHLPRGRACCSARSPSFPRICNRAYGMPLAVAGSVLMLYGVGGMGLRRAVRRARAAPGRSRPRRAVAA
jgi:hypothetical protein